MESINEFWRQFQTEVNNDTGTSEDEETYYDILIQLAVTKKSLFYDSEDWTFISTKKILPLAEYFLKLDKYDYKQKTLGEYLIIMKYYGKIFYKKAIRILTSALKLTDPNTLYMMDTDIILASLVGSKEMYPIVLSPELCYERWGACLPYSSKTTSNYLRISSLAIEFYTQIIEKGDFNSFDFLNSDTFLKLMVNSDYYKNLLIILRKVIPKIFRIILEKYYFSMSSGNELENILMRLTEYLQFCSQKEIGSSFKKFSYFSEICTEIIYNSFCNTNILYMDITKVFYVKRKYGEEFLETYLEKQDIQKMMFGEMIDPNIFNFNYVEPVGFTKIFFQFLHNYLQIILEKEIRSIKYEEESQLKNFRINSLIFHNMFLYRQNKNESLLGSINIIKRDGIVSNADNNLNSKISKSLDHYIAYTRFLLIVASNYNEIFILSIENSEEMERLRFVNFNSLFNLTLSISQMDLLCALVSCWVLKIFIELFKFDHYKHLVLEKFLIFLIMLRKHHGYAKHFIPYYEFIIQQISDEELNNREKYYFISLLKPNLICDLDDLSKTDDTSLRFQKLVEYANMKCDIKSKAAVSLNIKEIMTNIKFKDKYEKFVYLCLIMEYSNHKHLFISLNSDEEFKKSFMKLITNLIHKKDYYVNIHKQQFAYVLDKEYLLKIFQIINTFNFQIKEFSKIPDYNKYTDNYEFLNHFIKKLEKNMTKSTTIEFSNLIVRHTIRAYFAINPKDKDEVKTRSRSKYNIQPSTNINLQDYLDDNGYFPTISNDSFLSRFKIYFSFNRHALVKYHLVKKTNNIESENLNFIETTQILLKMNQNIQQDNSNHSCVISNIIMVNKGFENQIDYYLVMMNIHKFDKNSDFSFTKGLITRYLNSLILSNERSIVIRVFSIMQMMKNYFDDIEHTIRQGIPDKTYTNRKPDKECQKYLSYLGKYLRAYEVDYESQDSNISISEFLNRMKNDLKNYAFEKVADFNKKYCLWKNIIKNINKEMLIEYLSSFGFNKTCVYLLEDFVNTEMIESKNKSIEEYQNDFFISKYYQCFSKIDENDYIMKKYVISEKLNMKLNKFKDDYSNRNIQSLNDILDEFYCKLKYESLEEESTFIYDSNYKLPANLYFERVLLGLILKMYKIMGISKLEKLKKESNILMDNVKSFIYKLYTENEKTYGQFYQNKIYYELQVIFESIISDSMQKILTTSSNIRVNVDLYDPSFYKCTINKVEELYRTRRLDINTNNLLHFKIRRLMCNLFKLKESEQSMIKDIMKVYKILNDRNNITKYLQEFSKNFQLDSSRPNELYTILKFNLYMENILSFYEFYDTYSTKFGYDLYNKSNLVGSNSQNISKKTKEDYKFYLLKIQSMFNTHTTTELIYDINTHLKLRGFDSILDNIFKQNNTSYLKKITKKDFMIENHFDINEYCDIVMILIDCMMKDPKVKLDSVYVPNEPIDLESIIILTKYMIAICTLSSEKKILFKISHLIINYLMKLDKICVHAHDLKETVCSLTEVLLTWQVEKLYFIIPQLIMMSTEAESIMTEASMKLLTKYIEAYPHINGFLLASFLNTDVSDIKKYQNMNQKSRFTEEDFDNMKRAYSYRLKFGRKIFDNLKKRSQDIISDYIHFTQSLIEIQTLVRNENNIMTEDQKRRNIRTKVKQINEWIEKHNKKIILPTLKNMSRNFGFNYQDNNMQNPDKMVSYQSLRVIPEFDESRNDENRVLNKYYNEKSNFEMIENSQENFIIKMSETYSEILTKDRPVKITFITKKQNHEIRQHFIIKGNIDDSVNEVRALELLNCINNIFKYEGLDKNYALNLKQYNFVPISPHKMLIEWMDKMEIFSTIFEKVYTKFGIDENTEFTDMRNQKLCPKWCEKMGVETNKLYEHFLDDFVDPNIWYEKKLRYIISTAIWSMTGYIIGLGDRHTQNIMISPNFEVCHIDYGYMLGLARYLGVPEIVDFRFTKNIRRALGIFEEQGYFLFISKEALKALFKHFDSIETRLLAFIKDPLIKNSDR